LNRKDYYKKERIGNSLSTDLYKMEMLPGGGKDEEKQKEKKNKKGFVINF
jgi:hypothetical protein